MKRKGISSVFFKVLFISISVGFLVLLATLAITLKFSIATLHEKNDNTLKALAISLSQSEIVKESLMQGTCSPSLMSFIDSLIANLPTMSVLTIADTNSIRLYHVVHSRIGQPFVGGDQGDCLDGKAYFSNAVGTLGLQRRFFSPVMDADNTVIGFVMASTTISQSQEFTREILRAYFGLAILLSIISILFSFLTSLFIQKVLLGFSPFDLVQSYLKQNEVLNALTEGVILVDTTGNIQLANSASEKMLGHPSDFLVGKTLNMFIQDIKGGSIIDCDQNNFPTNRPNLLATCLPLKERKRTNGNIVILTDRSEAMRNAEQLSGTRHIISALRANSHEFMNKLQVLSGLLQMNKTNEAQEYINTVSALHSQSLTPFLKLIENTNVCALLLGKLNNAREMNIEVKLLPNSHLSRHSPYLTTTELITIIGNLFENAIEAINAQISEGLRNITLQITEDNTGLLIMFSDTGIGMTQDIIDHIFEEGFSTKGQKGRGYGMYLLQKLVNRNHGTIEIDSDPGYGTTFTIIFHEKNRELYGDTYNNNRR
ncbi:MAG: sensor histidine kinase [Treponema sp.]|nr:sensor histidine kinase [Treponema sp.]